MDYDKVLEQYNKVIDDIVSAHQETIGTDKRVRLSFGKDAPSFVLSDIAIKDDGKINSQLLDLNRNIMKRCVDLGKLPVDKPVYFGLARLLEFYGLLQYSEEDLSRFIGNIPEDLMKREPEIVIE